MKPVAFTAIAALLGACSTATTTAPTVDTIGTALYSVSGSATITVAQNGSNHALSVTPGFTHTAYNGLSVTTWPSTTFTTSGSGIVGSDHVFAAGLDNGTYFAGISGNPTAGVPSGGTASLTGLYAFVVNGADASGPLALTADFGNGTLTDTTAGITVNGRIWGSGVTGTVDIGGETSALKAGFYTTPVSATYPHGYVLDGVALGSNMAGVISLH